MDISTDGLTLNIKLDKASNIEFVTGGGIAKKRVKNITQASYHASPDDDYVRVRVMYTDSDGLISWAWTNPVYIDILPLN